MSTPTATMPAPKGNSLEIVYTTLERQDEQGKALKEVVKVMIETKLIHHLLCICFGYSYLLIQVVEMD